MHLDQEVVVEDGETLDEVARELIGPRSSVTYELLGILPGDNWPTIRFFGTKQQLGAIKGKAMGSPIGRPKK